MSRLGILGGTFDPPHLGHLILAECALDALHLSRVLFVPSGDPPHKRGRIVTPITHRLPMLQAAIADNPRFELSRADIDRAGPHYSADTVRLLQAQYTDAELFFLMGSDSLRDFPTWHAPEEIVKYAQLAVMRRPGPIIDLSGLTVQIPTLAERVQFVDAPEVSISATDLRERVRAGLSIRYQVPEVVAAYIDQHGLYQA